MDVIPKKLIKQTSSDKPWLNAVIKSLINDRWNAYKSKQFAIYRSLSSKIKRLIISAKNDWSRRISNNTHNPWNVVNRSFGIKKKSDISLLLNTFPNKLSGVNEINNKFYSVFGSKSDYTFNYTANNEDSNIII